MCVSINGPGDLDLWPFDLETGVRVASKVGNFPSKFGHARPLGSRIIRYVTRQTDARTDSGRTDGRTDKSNAYCPFPTGEGIINHTWTIILLSFRTYNHCKLDRPTMSMVYIPNREQNLKLRRKT